jgi:hypothetical protein
MVTPILSQGGSSSSFPSNSSATNNYLGMEGGPTATGIGGLTSAQSPMPIYGYFSNLYVSFPTTITQGTYTISLNLNGSPTTLSCIVQSGAQTCNDTTDIVHVTPGNLVAWGIAPSGTPTAQTAQLQISATFTSDVGQESPIFKGISNGPSTTAINYVPVGVASAGASSTEAPAETVIPTGGTIDQLYIDVITAVGTGATFTYTLMKGGSPTALTCTTAVNGTSCSDLVDSVSVIQGDVISIQTCPSNTATCPAGSVPGTFKIFGVGMRWVPTTSNEAILMTEAIAKPATNATNYGLASGSTTNASTEVDLNLVPIGMTVKDLTVSQSPAPGGSTTRTITLREGTGTQGSVGTPGNVACTVTSAATTCTDNTNTFAATAGTFINMMYTVSGSNAGLTNFRVGSVVTVP